MTAPVTSGPHGAVGQARRPPAQGGFPTERVADAVPPQAPRTPATPRTPAAARPMFVTSTVLLIVSVLALTFVATLSVIGAVRHARDQQTAFADLRGTLANATTPVTQADDAGRLSPLGTPLAVIDIPQLNLREVMFEGTTGGVLQSGPGHRRDTPMPGQAGTSVIMGRQAAYGGPFGSIGDLVPGDVFAITTGQGRQTFRVIAVRRAGDPAPQPPAAGKSRVLLITAAGAPWVPQGLLRVDADLVGQVQPAGPRPLSSSALPMPERAMESDLSVMIWILLLSQALLISALSVTWARYRWGRWQVWLSGGPLLFAVGVALCDQIAQLLPNLL